MSDFEKLSALMKADWNRRLRHDYRFWMSDGVSDDRVMWESGARDFEILCEGIPLSGQESFLELGCGVGRLLASALKKCGRVIGVDVSEEAIKKAAELLPKDPKLQLIAGNGYNLSEVQSGSIDLAVSFAAITSMPTDVIANYLVELYRILKPEGCMRLQIYLGEEQQLAHADTLHLRCFQPENFKNGLEAAGFDIEWIKELVLPFQVSFKEHGLETFIASFRKPNRSPRHPNEISRLLLPL